MKSLKNLFALLVVQLFAVGTMGARSPEKQIYEAFVTGQMDRWVVAMNELERRWQRSGDFDDRYALVEAQYGYIAFLIADKQKKLARQYVREAEEHLEQMIEKNERHARSHAMLGAVYGFKVGLDPYKAVVFGKRAFDENNRAFELAPDDPQVWMEKANIELYKPTVFGDNSLEAMKMYQKAVRLYEQDPGQTRGNWLYLNALVGLASAAIEAEQYGVANATYRKILRIEPRFEWIRDEVYPVFREKYGY